MGWKSREYFNLLAGRERPPAARPATGGPFSCNICPVRACDRRSCKRANGVPAATINPGTASQQSDTRPGLENGIACSPLSALPSRPCIELQRNGELGPPVRGGGLRNAIISINKITIESNLSRLKQLGAAAGTATQITRATHFSNLFYRVFYDN